MRCAYPLLLSGGFFVFELLNGALAAGLEGFELLLLEGPVIGDAGILLRFGFFIEP